MCGYKAAIAESLLFYFIFAIYINRKLIINKERNGCWIGYIMQKNVKYVGPKIKNKMKNVSLFASMEDRIKICYMMVRFSKFTFNKNIYEEFERFPSKLVLKKKKTFFSKIENLVDQL